MGGHGPLLSKGRSVHARKVETDGEICSFIIPKGTQVLLNTWSIGRDPSVWEDPNLFKPERFLGSEIDVRGQDMELIPFGGGRRICPGSPLALRMVHMIFGSLINSFDWKLKQPKDLKMEEKFGITLQKACPLRVFPVFTSEFVLLKAFLNNFFFVNNKIFENLLPKKD